ncbi:TPA: hypothetical protein ACLBBY_001677 [Neisseria meningitidis]
MMSFIAFPLGWAGRGWHYTEISAVMRLCRVITRQCRLKPLAGFRRHFAFIL